MEPSVPPGDPAATTPTTPDPAPPDAVRRSSPWYRNPWLWAFVAGAVALHLMRPLLRRIPEPPPVLAQIPAFSLVDQDGRPFGSAELAGRPYVVEFFFTDCPGICKTLTERMAGLQKRFTAFARPVQLVSVTVNPEDDTPAKLRAYGERFGADFAGWHFLTGEPDAVRRVIAEGFMTEMGVKQVTGPGVFDVAHAASFALVDAEGRLRGVYGTDEPGLDELYERTLSVLAQGRP